MTSAAIAAQRHENLAEGADTATVTLQKAVRNGLVGCEMELVKVVLEGLECSEAPV